MKTILSFLVVALLLVAPVIAQKPIQDTIPQLKEWWRVDNLGYGAAFGRDDNGGMTWLDNFYNGKGALVVSSPDGVKTWQMRFPGDTTNVFTWKGKGGPWRTLDGGNPTIKTGDFNGDGATDYIDAWGNIYEGIKNGEPPKSEAQTPVPFFFPWIVTDINGDGKEDMIKPGMPGSVLLGKTNLKEIINQKMILPELDSNNVPIVAYMVGAKEMRIICTRTYWTNNKNFPFRTIYKDGLRLVRAWWDGTTFKSEVLDEFTYTTQNGNQWSYGGKLFKQSPSEIYYLCQHGEGIITVYNLHKDKFENFSTITNPIGLLGSLRHSIDNDTLPDFFAIQQTPEGDYFTIYSGDVSKGIHPICKFVTPFVVALSSLGDVTGDGNADLVLCNKGFFSDINIKYRFTILTTKDSISSVVAEQNKNLTFSITVLPPMPVKRSQVVPIKVIVPKTGNYSLTLFDYSGKTVCSQTVQLQPTGEHSINFDMPSFPIASGGYTLQLEGNGSAAHCSIIIQ